MRRRVLLILAIVLNVTAVALTYAQILTPYGLFHERHSGGDPRAAGLLFFTWVLTIAAWVGFWTFE